MKLLQNLTILLTTFTLALAATIPNNIQLLELPSDNINSSAPLNLTSSAGIHCNPTIPLSPFYLTMHGCAHTIYELESSQELGNFHNGYPYDDFSLPVTRTVSYCKVTVEMNNLGITERSSWLGISHAVTQLNLLCSSRYKYRYGGGWTLTGTNNQIKVRIDWRGTEGVQNETLTDLGLLATD